MSVSSRKQFTLRIVAKGNSEKLAMADLFDELDVVNREYHIAGMKELDDKLRAEENRVRTLSDALRESQRQLKEVNESLYRVTNGNPVPRCTKLGVIQAMVTLLKDHDKWGNGIGLMELKHAMDRIW